MAHAQPNLPDGGTRARSSLIALASLLTVAALFAWYLDRQTNIVLLAALRLLLAWCALGAVAEVIGGNRTVLRQGALLLGAMILSAWFVYPAWRNALPLSVVSAATLKSFATLLLGAAAVLHFFANYTKLVLAPDARPLLVPALPLTRVAAVATALASAAIFLALSSTYDFTVVLGEIFLGLTLLFAAESLLRPAVRFYQPASHRTAPKPLGSSLLLDFFTGSGRGLGELARETEKLFGIKLADFWMARFLAETAEAMLLAGVLLAWLSTCLTAVPLGSQGVLISFGRFAPEPLLPGLHVTLPWPLQEIALVSTQAVREISLGFDQDLAGPVLWTQKHYVGEQSLLVGDGESLLTIDVPIEYQVSDPVAFLTATSDPAAALKGLAQRDLIRATRSRESFQIMTTDRAPIAEQLQQALQHDCEQLNLGLRILFVALKDVHPPVDVAPAYERVVSSEESKEAAIHLASAYEASVLPDARAQANRLDAEATAAATQRIDQATGESGRFTLLASAEHESPALFYTRWRYDALDQGLATPAKIIVGLTGASAPGTYLDLRNQTGGQSPRASQPPLPTLPARAFEKEVTEH